MLHLVQFERHFSGVGGVHKSSSNVVHIYCTLQHSLRIFVEIWWKHARGAIQGFYFPQCILFSTVYFIGKYMLVLDRDTVQLELDYRSIVHILVKVLYNQDSAREWR